MRTIMSRMGLNENLNNSLWIECASTTNKFENIMVKPHKDKFAHEIFYGRMSDYKDTKRISVKWGL